MPGNAVSVSLLGVNVVIRRLGHTYARRAAAPAVIIFDCLNLQSIHYHTVITDEGIRAMDEKGVMVMIEGLDVCDRFMSLIDNNSGDNIVYVAINTADGVWYGKSNIVFYENTIHPKMHDDIGNCTTCYASISMELTQPNDTDNKFECEFDIEIIDLMKYSQGMHQEEVPEDEFQLEEITKYSYTSNAPEKGPIACNRQNDLLNDVTDSVNNSSVLLTDADMSALKGIFNKDRYTKFYNETAVNEYPNDLEIENILRNAEAARRDKIDQALFPPRAAARAQVLPAQRYKNNKKKLASDNKEEEVGYFYSRVGPSDPKATLNLLKSKLSHHTQNNVTASIDKPKVAQNVRISSHSPNLDITKLTKVTNLADVGVPLPLPTPMFFQKE